MDVFDSNIWIYGLTGKCDDAVSLVEKAVTTPFHVGVSAYIFEEVIVNLQRSSHSHETITRLQTRFADIVHGNHTIHGPTQEQIAQLDLETHRTDPRVQAMGEAFGIQNKDVPVVVFARQCAQRPDAPMTTIYTADEGFAEFEPDAYFEKLALQYVDCSE